MDKSIYTCYYSLQWLANMCHTVTAVRLSGLDDSLTLPWLAAQGTVLGPDAGKSDPAIDFCARRAKLGGMYSFFVTTCDCGAPGTSVPSPAIVLALLEPSTLVSTALTMVLCTPFFASSHLRSACVASETPGPVKRITTEVLAVLCMDHMVESLSSSVVTSNGR